MKKKGFTLIELLVVLIILGLIASITTPIVLKTVANAKESANKRSVDGYGKSIEIAIADKLLLTGETPTTLEGLDIKYEGNEVNCEESVLYEDGHIYLTKCKVGGKEVKDSSTDDGYYHYGKKGGEEPTPPGPTPPGPTPPEPQKEYQAFKVGDKITYKGEEYYTIEASSKTQDYVTLLKAEPLKSDEMRDIISGTEIASKVNLSGTYAEVAFLTKSDYSQSVIKQVVDVWANSKLTISDLKEVGNYKERLIKFEDLINNLGYDRATFIVSYYQVNPEYTPSWVYNDNYWYWTMSQVEDSNYQVWSVGNSGHLNEYEVDYGSLNGAVRPVINLLKDKVESYEPAPEPGPTPPEPTPEIDPDPEEEDEEEEKYEEYYQGQEIEYNGIQYYVAKDSGKKRSYVTLVKKDSLTANELGEYTEVEETQGEYGVISFSKDNSTNNYKDSSIKDVIDRWTSNNTIDGDLKSVSGYKSRILSYTELVEDLGYNQATHNDGYFDNDSEYTPSYIKDKGYSYLTMSGIEGTAKGVWRVNAQGQLTSKDRGNPFTDGTEQTTYLLDKEDWGYNDAYCYYWSDENPEMISWPGVQATYKGTYNGGYVHACEVPDDAQYLVFSKGEHQTEDLLLNRKQYYDNVSREWNNIPTEEISTKGTVRPVINLLKEKIVPPEPEPEIEYRIGDQITYKGENYYVIENSLESQDYITLLKGNPLTEKEVKAYGEYKNTVNGYGTSNYSNNSTDYNTSIVKQTVDTWSEARFRNDELEEINNRNTQAFIDYYIGRDMEVLVEENDGEYLTGHTPEYVRVKLPIEDYGTECINSLVRCRGDKFILS